MTDVEIDELYERSKDDRAFIAGSEVRQIIGDLLYAQRESQEWQLLANKLRAIQKSTAKSTDDALDLLEKALRELEALRTVVAAILETRDDWAKWIPEDARERACVRDIDRALAATPRTLTAWQMHREGKCSGVPGCEVCVIVAARMDSL